MAKDFRKEENAEPTVFGVEEASARKLEEFDNPAGDRLYTLSDIIPKEVFGLNLIKIMGNIFCSKVVDDWLENHLRLRISMYRKGRSENILIVTGLRQIEEKRGKTRLADLFQGLR